MRKYLILVLILLMAVSFASAVPNSLVYNEKIYYVVTSMDPSMDTGDNPSELGMGFSKAYAYA